MSSPILKRICCCFRKSKDKKEVQKLKKDGERLQEILDLEILFKSMKKISFFQELLLKKNQIQPKKYKWNLFDKKKRKMRQKISILTTKRHAFSSVKLVPKVNEDSAEKNLEKPQSVSQE